MIIDEKNYKDILYPVFKDDQVIFLLEKSDKYAVVKDNLIRYESKENILKQEYKYPKTLEDVNNALVLIDFLLNKVKPFYLKHQEFFETLLELKKNIQLSEKLILKELL